MEHIARKDAFELLKKYNKDPFHIQHALTVEAVMKWYANELGYAEDAEYWGIAGLLHDIDFELYPEEHCLKAPELLREAGVSEDLIHAVCSHGYGITVGCGKTIDVEPVHEMEKVLFAADELTATSKNLNDLKLQKANAEKVAAEQLAAAKELAEKIEKLTVTLKMKAGEGGKAFGSVSSKEIAAAAADQLKLDIDKKKLVLPEPIKTFGNHEVPVKLHKDVTAKLTVKVTEA